MIKPIELSNLSRAASPSLKVFRFKVMACMICLFSYFNPLCVEDIVFQFLKDKLEKITKPGGNI